MEDALDAAKYSLEGVVQRAADYWRKRLVELRVAELERVFADNDAAPGMCAESPVWIPVDPEHRALIRRNPIKASVRSKRCTCGNTDDRTCLTDSHADYCKADNA